MLGVLSTWILNLGKLAATAKVQRKTQPSAKVLSVVAWCSPRTIKEKLI